MKTVKLYKYNQESKKVFLVDTEVDDNFEFEYVPQVVRVKNGSKNQFYNKIVKVRKDLVLANAELSGERVIAEPEKIEVLEEVVPEIEVAIQDEVVIEEEKKTKSKKVSGKKGSSTNKD